MTTERLARLPNVFVKVTDDPNLPITASPTLAMSILPLSNLRVSSGDFRFLRTPCLRIAVPSAISNLLYKNNPPPAPIRTGAPANRTFDGGRRR